MEYLIPRKDSAINHEVDELLQSVGVSKVLRAIEARLLLDANENHFNPEDEDEMSVARAYQSIAFNINSAAEEAEKTF